MTTKAPPEPTDGALLQLNPLSPTVTPPSSIDATDNTPDGQRVAASHTKVHDRLLRPLLAADKPPAPLELRHVLTTIDRHIHTYIDHARLGKAA